MTRSRYDAVLFDFHGTLAYTPGDWGALYAEVLATCGHRLDPAAISAAVMAVWDTIDHPDGIEHLDHSADEAAYDAWRTDVESRWLRALGVDPVDPSVLRGIFAAQDDPLRFALFEDVLPTLEALATAGLRMGVISNFAWHLPAAAEHLGVGRYMEFVVTSARAGYRKPHPEIFRAALARLGLDAGRVLYVGDSYLPDVQGPRRVGMDAVLLDRKGRSLYDCATIHALHQLPALVVYD
jgi:putative hydrolase of the HAD superfamily